MRCDLHVHTVHSGMCNIPVLKTFCRESYSEPEALYSVLKRRGMSLVTVTDHDCIDAVERLRRHPDFFLSEEVTCELPSGTEMHIGVYDLDDRQHIEVQRRRRDFESLIAYLREQRLFYSANHVFSSLTGRRVEDDFERFALDFDAMEVLNGCMLAEANNCARQFAARSNKIGLGGSDAHTLGTAGTAWTEVPGARTRSEFLAGLRQGRGVVKGESGSYWKLTRDILNIGVSMVQTNPVTAPVTLFCGFAPLITLANYFLEKNFAREWSRRVIALEALAPVSEEVAA